MREILSSVEDVLLPIGYREPKAGDDPRIIERILNALDLPSDTPTERLMKVLRQHFRPDEGSSRHKRMAIVEALGLSPDHDVPRLYEELTQLHRLAHRSRLDSPRPFEPVRESWRTFEDLLSHLLDQHEKNYASAYEKIEIAIAAGDLSTFQGKVPQNFRTQSYFFQRATGGQWFERLKKSGTFGTPPVGGGWPALDYLRGIASEHPSDIRDILLEMPRTSNELVLMGVLDIVEHLPEQDSLLVLRHFHSDITESIGDGFVQREYAEKVARSAAQNPELALQLLLPLIELYPLSGSDEDVPELGSRVDEYTYGEIVDGPLRSVTAIRPNETLARLLELLETALYNRFGSPEEGYSNIWRPAVERHEQNRHLDPLDHLLDAVREAAEATSTDDDEAADVIRNLSGSEWGILKRLSLHLARVSLPPSHPLTRELVFDPGTLLEREGRHEKHLLVEASFPHLSKPDQEKFVESILSRTEVPGESEAASEQRLRNWKRSRLGWIAEFLPDHARDIYDELLIDTPPRGPGEDFDFYTTAMWVGPTSPKSVQDFQEMSVPEIRDFLHSWVPPGGMMAHTREGVGRELSTAVASRAKLFAEHAGDFRSLDPTFVRAIISGLTGAVRDSTPIDWEPVLQLTDWAVSQPREIEGRKPSSLDNDPDWGWTRKQIARLLQAGFVRGDGNIPLQYRAAVWQILAVVIEDPDPEPSRNDRDPLFTAINSTRGTAMQTVIAYAAWVRGGEFRPRSEAGPHFGDMPEVKTLLEQHLDPKYEDSPAIRAVYGEQLFHLFVMEPQWVIDNLPHLFPENADLREPAWQTYVTYGRFSPETLVAFASQYDQAIEHLDQSQPIYSDYIERLGTHVLYQYLLLGNATDQDSPIFRFLRAGGEDVRTQIVHIVPSILKVDPDSRSAPERARQLWEFLLGNSPDYAELKGFGSWLESDAFEPKWRLQQLKTAIERSGLPIREHAVVETLAELSGSHGQAVLEILELLINAADNHPRIYRFVYDGAVERILASAMSEEAAPELSAKAKEIANRLVAKGFSQFLTLVKRSDESV